MPSWRVSLTSPSGEQIHKQNVDQRTHATIYIEGNTADADTWRFVKYDEETQARRDWISQFGKFTSICRAAFTFCQHLEIYDANQYNLQSSWAVLSGSALIL